MKTTSIKISILVILSVESGGAVLQIGNFYVCKNLQIKKGYSAPKTS